MSKFVVSYISFFNNDLLSTVVESESESDAFLEGIYRLQCISLGKEPGDKFQDEWIQSLEGLSVEQVKNACFDCDSAVNIIKI